MGTVGKALELLDYFTRARPQIGLSDFARLSGLNKATCHRLLTELQEFGFVEQAGLAREYRLGPAMLRLAALREAHVPMQEAAQPVLRRLALATGETAHLSVIVGEKLAMIGFAYAAAHGTKVTMEDTEILPFHATSSGLVLMAFAAPALCERILAQRLEAYTPQTETDPARLRAVLDQARAEGMTESTSAYEADVHSFAVPLFDATNTCTGALAVAAPDARVTPALAALIRTELTRAGAEITALWGGSLPPELVTLWQQS